MRMIFDRRGSLTGEERDLKQQELRFRLEGGKCLPQQVCDVVVYYLCLDVIVIYCHTSRMMLDVGKGMSLLKILIVILI